MLNVATGAAGTIGELDPTQQEGVKVVSGVPGRRGGWALRDAVWRVDEWQHAQLNRS